MNTNKLKCNVILLKSNEGRTSMIYKNHHTKGVLNFGIPIHINKLNYDIYFTSDREIREGDYYQRFGKGSITNKITEHKGCKCKRVEATTDVILSKETNIPLIPNDFIVKFVEKQGKIEEVYLELDIHNREEFKPILTDSYGYCIIVDNKDLAYKLIVGDTEYGGYISDNPIMKAIINKEKLYTKEEVKEIACKFWALGDSYSWELKENGKAVSLVEWLETIK